MMRHIVMFRRRDDVPAHGARERALVHRMRGLDKHIDCMRAWRLSANEVARPICWDYVLECAFDDEAALNAYLAHPAHQALIEDLRHYFVWAAVDYTLAS